MQKKILLSVLAVALLIGGAVLVWQKKMNQRPAMMNSSDLVNNIESSDVARYENSTVGLAFDYPKTWRINEGEFSGGKGDGRSSFAITLTPPNWDGSSSIIGISHFPLRSQENRSFDNLSIQEQLALISCASPSKYGRYDKDDSCEVRTNPNGVQYVWTNGYVDQKAQGYGSTAMFPTGKYIVSFNIFDEKKESFQKDLEYLKVIVDSIELR